MGDVIYMTELLDLRQDLNDAGEGTDKAVRMLVMETAEKVAARAREYAPRKTGKLMNSIQVQITSKGAKVVATDPKAVFHEFGTWSRNIIEPKSGTYEIRPVRADALRFTTSSGVVFAKRVRHPGVPAVQFLGRANQEVTTELADQIGDVAVTLLMGE